jgi:serine/threonine protein kinase
VSPSRPLPASSSPAGAAVPDAEFIAFQQAVAGRYSLERELGRGGMGIVYLARELRLSRPVAIKVLPRALAAARPELREKFLREAQTAAQLSHPNVVPIHHVDEAGEFVFFVMTYIEGETLGERIRSRGPFSPSEAARVLREIGWALAYAHLRGIVHRDVKPDNILLERGADRALVTDFGIAGATLADAPADASYIRGTAHFLSPEQAMGEPTDGRSDIYSLGVVGYYALTGQLPFDGATTVEVMAGHIAQRPKPMQGFAPHVPRQLASAVEKCLEKDRERRWRTGEEFAEAVDAAFEQPREIPAPLRVWLSRSDAAVSLRVAVLAPLLFVSFASLAFGPLLFATPLLLAILVAPDIANARRLLRQGFTLADLRNALAIHTRRRREEIQVDPTFTPISRRSLRITAGVSFGVTALTTAMIWNSGISAASPLALFAGLVSVALGIASTLGALGVRLYKQDPDRFGERRLKFWNGKWGERLMRLAGIGLEHRAGASPALPQHTEVALGRATDALFAALPKRVRHDLKSVPETVRRLEREAGALRESLDTLDELLAGAPDPALLRRRDLAAERLATTVTALENVRLGLLRLQLGAAPVAQVTEAIEAAARIGREIELALDAGDEVAPYTKGS